MPRQRYLVLMPRKVGERFRLAEIDRKIRRDALSRIYDALGLVTVEPGDHAQQVETFWDRVNVTREILSVLFDYFKARDNRHSTDVPNILLGRWFHNIPFAKRDKWLRDVAKHAEALVDLYVEHPIKFGWLLIEQAEHELDEESDPFTIFSEIAVAARYHLKHRPDPKKKKPDITTGYLLDELDQIFFDKIGREGKRSHDPTKRKPSGRFFELVRGVYDLGGIDKKEEGIATDIRRWRERKRP